MRIAVLDGQGGGIGKVIVDKIRKELPETTEIIALGTNAIATMLMMKAGANEGASGENAVVYNCNKVDIIVGSIGIVVANSMLEELSPKIAQAIAEIHAKKVLIPLGRCNIEVAGVKNEPLPLLIDNAIAIIKGCF